MVYKGQYKGGAMLTSVRETGRRIHHRVQQVANAAAAAGMATAAAGGLAAARGIYEKARPGLLYTSYAADDLPRVILGGWVLDLIKKTNIESYNKSSKYTCGERLSQSLRRLRERRET